MNVKEAVFKRIRRYLSGTAGDMSEEAMRRGLSQINSKDAAKLVKKTLKKTVLPIAGAGAAVGIATGLGFGIGKRLSDVGRPTKVDPSTYYPPQGYKSVRPDLNTGPGFVGAKDAITASQEMT